MVSTYTDNLRITKQGDNDNPNTWGQIVNNQVITLLEEAVTGVIAVDCTGSSDINLATAVVNGATDSARHAVLELTGTIGANINLILPSVEKVYIIRANFTGAYTITVKPTGGSSGIAFSNTKAAIIYTNGTAINEVTPSVTDGDKGDITVSSSGTVWTIDANAVTETKIVDDAVTAAKIATGAVTNDGLNKTAITGQASATVVVDDLVLISDTNDSGILKQVEAGTISDLGAGRALEYTKAQNFNATTLTDGATIDWDLESNQVASVTLAGNRSLNAPTNMKDGGTYVLIVKQDATGSRTLSYDSAYKFARGAAPVLTTTANAVDILTFVSDGTNMYGVIQKAFA
jgi:hypothetical protein